MEYHVEMKAGVAPDVERVALALQELDPAAVVDFNAAGARLRIDTGLAARELVELLGGIGIAVAPAQVHAQPSVCCGGCGG